MGGHQHGGTQAGRLPQRRGDRARVGLVEAAGRLVHQQQPRSGSQRAGDGDALLFAARQRSGATVGHLRQAESRQELIDAGDAAAGRNATQP